MKKFLALLLVMMLIMTSFTACGSKDDAEVETPDTNLEQDVESGDEEANADAEADTEEEGEADADTEGEADADQEEESVKEEEREEVKPADKKEETKPADKDTDKKEESKPADKDTDKKEEKPADKQESGSTSGEASAAGTPAEIIDKIYANHKAIEMPLGTMEVDLTDPDALKMFTGLGSADKISAAAVSESMMGAQAYSLVVVKVKDAKDADAVATEMMNGIDQRKWICVEADDLRVSAAGDTVVLIMVGSAHADAATAASITDAFSAAAGGLDLNKSK